MNWSDIIGNGRVAGIAILCAVFFTGCPKRNDVVTGPTVPIGGGQPAADARGAATTAQGTLDAATAERLDRINADIKQKENA